MRKLKITAIVCVAVVALLIVIGAIGSACKTNKTTPSRTSNTPAAATGTAPAATSVATTPAPTVPQETPTPAVAANQKKIGGLLLTVNANQPYTDDLFPAEAGTHYVSVDITAKNVGTGTYSLNVLNFHLKDSAGYTGESALTNGPDPKIGSHEMVPGQEVRGFIVFKLGDGRNPVELQYQSFTGAAGVIPIAP